MKHYRIKVIETNYGIIEVDAESIEEAKEKAEEEMLDANVYWANGDTDFESIEEVKR